MTEYEKHAGLALGRDATEIVKLSPVLRADTYGALYVVLQVTPNVAPSELSKVTKI
jgi:hypothetical protein